MAVNSSFFRFLLNFLLFFLLISFKVLWIIVHPELGYKVVLSSSVCCVVHTVGSWWKKILKSQFPVK